jgi:hypothetical protein
MDKAEAQRILRDQLARFSSRNHAQLAPLAESRRAETFVVRGESGATYQVEVQFVWDGQPGGTVRMIGSIDDGGVRAIFPLTETLLVSPLV